MSNPDQRPASEAEPAQSATNNVGDHWLGRTLRRLFGSKAGSIRADLRTALEKGASAAGFSPKESTMLRNILSLRERRVADVMVPRADIIAVQKGIALGDLLKVFASQAHSRLVVYDDTLDDAIGMVHIRDLIALMTGRAAEAAAERPGEMLPTGLDLKAIDLALSLSAAKLVREILFAPPSMPVIDLLAKMQATRIHLALVVDEYDEDLAPGVVRQADGSYLANARASLEDATAIIGPEFDVGEVAQEVDTLAGYVATRIGRLPVRGEIVPGPGKFEIEVLDADPRRVKRLKIYRSLDRPARARAAGGLAVAGDPSAARDQPTSPSSDSPQAPTEP